MRIHWVLGLLALLMLGACNKQDVSSDTTGPTGSTIPDDPPDLLRVTKDTPNLLFRYESGKNASGIEYSVAPTIDEIPKKARKAVQVVDLNQSPEQRRAGKYVQIFDLSRARPDGSYSGRVVSLVNFDLVPDEAARRLIEGEREAIKKGQSSKVIMYSTAWCGVCKRAKKFMDRKNIAYVEKDIEKDHKARAELILKGKNAGISVRGVPVFDVNGTMFPGFDKDRLVSLLGE